jgi:apolipoprotein N-acyltransferase
MTAPTDDLHQNDFQEKRTVSRILVFQCLLAAAVGMYALSDSDRLLSLALFLVLPVVVFSAATALHAFLIAFTYYTVGARAVPGIIAGFFPGMSWAECISLWAGHAAVLALVWALFHAPPSATAWRRGLGATLVFIALSVPPIGLVHWGSPLVAAGLFYPGMQIFGVFMMAALFVALVTVRRDRPASMAATAGLLLVSLALNLTYAAPQPPAAWRGVTLDMGRGPGLWSDEMLTRRQTLVAIAREELRAGARVIVFPESVSGSNIRPQLELWQSVADEAARRGSTILVGQETWDESRSGYRNALIGFGAGVDDNRVFASSLVPMPMGEWKFWFEKGAEIDIFGGDVRRLHDRNISISICYEDFLLWAHPGLLTGKADLLVSVANQWPSSGTSSEVFQDTSRKSLARLAGVPLIVAKNR